jgi:hypothetical protein
MPNTKGHVRQLEQMVRGEIPPPPIAAGLVKRTLGFLECDVHDDSDARVPVFSSCMVLRGQDAKGR